MDIISYQYQSTRAARVMWVIKELNLDVSVVEGVHLIHSEELKKIHPQGKLPAIVDHGRPLFESVAIVNWLAEAYGPEGFIPKSGTWERAIYEQWTMFLLNEVEAYLWTLAKNTFLYPEEMRSKSAKAQAKYELKKSLGVLDRELSGRSHLVGNRFGALDINLAYILNWADKANVLEGFTHLSRYLDSMKSRPNSVWS